MFQENETLFGEMKQENRNYRHSATFYGYSNDKGVAVEVGATIVGADSAIFEKRDY